jgi:hypothetical protein
MDQLLAPVWSADLINARQIRLQRWLERLSALGRFRLDAVQPSEWGYGFTLERWTERFAAWWAKSSHHEQLFLLQTRELDPYGTYLLLTERNTPELGLVRGAICAWHDLPQAAEYLRSDCSS